DLLQRLQLLRLDAIEIVLWIQGLLENLDREPQRRHEVLHRRRNGGADAGRPAATPSASAASASPTNEDLRVQLSQLFLDLRPRMTSRSRHQQAAGKRRR